MSHTIHTGDSATVLKQYPDNYFDSIVTDPPYGIEFLGKDWDSNTGAVEIWQECFRVLKPGGHLLAFSAARTYHHLATNIESVGFEIRDQLMWIYASGFPKAQDIGKSIQRRQGVEEYEGFVDTTKNVGFGQTDHARVRAGVEWSTKQTSVGKARCTSPEAQQWSGWKTALKPAHEPIVMARKPFRGSTIDCVLRHGTGALNIDATRIPFENAKDQKSANDFDDKYEGVNRTGGPTFQKDKPYNEYSFGAPGTGVKQANLPPKFHPDAKGRFPSNVMGDIPDYQKYFYCPKVSRRERHCGFEQTNIPTNPNGMLTDSYNVATRGQNYNDIALTKSGNNHPTVKPVALMQYLVKLVTPPNSRVLDPFAGSGSTGMAAVELGHTFIGCEQDPAYVAIANRRIEAWSKQLSNPDFDRLFDHSSD